MTSYRVAEPTDDPLTVDEELCRSQRWKQRLLIHVILSVFTVGLWLPVLLIWLVMSQSLTAKWAAGYTARIQGGMLAVGNASELRSLPLDAIADVRVHDGYMTVSVRGSGALQIYGLRDPLAASQAILEARDTHVRGLRGELAEAVMNAPVGEEENRRRRRAR